MIFSFAVTRSSRSSRPARRRVITTTLDPALSSHRVRADHVTRSRAAGSSG
jgi:hypothetical protein